MQSSIIRKQSIDLVEIALNRQCFALEEAIFCPFQGNKLPLKGNFQELPVFEVASMMEAYCCYPSETYFAFYPSPFNLGGLRMPMPRAFG